MAYENRSVEQQLRELQDQFRELSVTIQQRVQSRTPPRYRPEDDGEEEENYSQARDYNPYGRRDRGFHYNNDIKVDIPEYDGKLDADTFIEWMRTVVALKLQKYASAWWENVCVKRDRQGKAKVLQASFPKTRCTICRAVDTNPLKVYSRRPPSLNTGSKDQHYSPKVSCQSHNSERIPQPLLEDQFVVKKEEQTSTHKLTGLEFTSGSLSLRSYFFKEREDDSNRRVVLNFLVVADRSWVNPTNQTTPS
ncbi:hypothetical protein E3N88_14254 [Mikania micrantha]|uniref:Uncharacterized protein n=1 Tax=Mikania micrantha TaxID=192012 RepID=A0A5N6P0Y2_9ASTR|nr:hypothetical protein E3N88_14254 [Mikania micrantha]